MSPMTSEMTSNTSIVQKDDVHSTDGENVCNKKKRKCTCVLTARIIMFLCVD